jgi:hypothetical protein
VLSPREFHDKRNDASMRQVCTLERFVDFDQHEFLSQVDGSQMRADQLEIVRGQ